MSFVYFDRRSLFVSSSRLLRETPLNFKFNSRARFVDLMSSGAWSNCAWIDFSGRLAVDELQRLNNFLVPSHKLVLWLTFRSAIFDSLISIERPRNQIIEKSRKINFSLHFSDFCDCRTVLRDSHWVGNVPRRLWIRLMSALTTELTLSKYYLSAKSESKKLLNSALLVFTQLPQNVPF